MTAKFWPPRPPEDPALPAPPDWTGAALCAQSDPEAWYPEKGGSVALPKAICRRCPVRAECLEYALEHDERYGIWGGLSERQRRPMLAARHAEELAA